VTVVIPAAEKGSTLDVHVGSQTAVGVDLADTLASDFPTCSWRSCCSASSSSMLVFRSILVPLKAVIMNLLSIGASYGVNRRDLPERLAQEPRRDRQGRPDRGVGCR